MQAKKGECSKCITPENWEDEVYLDSSYQGLPLVLLSEMENMIKGFQSGCVKRHGDRRQKNSNDSRC